MKVMLHGISINGQHHSYILPAGDGIFEAKFDGKGNFVKENRRTVIVGTAVGGERGILVTCLNRCAVDYESDGSCQRSACGFYHHHPIGDIVTHLPLSRIDSTSLGPAGPALKNHALYEATRPTKDWTDRIKRARAALERRGEQRGKRKQSGWDVAREPRQQRSGQNAQSLKQSNWDTKRDLRHQRSGQNAQSHMRPSSSSSSSRAHADAGASKNYNTSEHKRSSISRRCTSTCLHTKKPGRRRATPRIRFISYVRTSRHAA